jgi:hypothetical protein
MVKVNESIDTFKKRIQIEMNTIDLRECIIDKTRSCKTTAVTLTCLARTDQSHQPSDIFECKQCIKLGIYYVTDNGYLTD